MCGLGDNGKNAERCTLKVIKKGGQSAALIVLLYKSLRDHRISYLAE